MFIPIGFGSAVHRFSSPAAQGQILWSLGWQWTGDIDQDAVDGYAAAFATSEYLSTAVSNEVTFEGVDFIVGTGDPTEPLHIESSASQVGGAGGDMCPINSAILVKKLTGRGGRKGRGRFYSPGVQIDALNNIGGLISDAALTNIQESVDALPVELGEGLVAGGPSAAQPVLLHATEADGAPDVLTSLVVQSRLATQRRRLRD